MKTKSRFLIKQSLSKKIKTKWFLAANILIAVLLIGLTNVDLILQAFGGDFDETNKIIVIDEANTYKAFETTFKSVSKNIENFEKFKLEESKKTIKELKKDLNEEENTIIVNIKLSEDNKLTADVITFDPIGMLAEQTLLTTLTSVKSQHTLINSNISPEEYAEITSPIKLQKIVTNPDIDENEEAKDLASSSALIIFLVPFFVLVVMLVQMVGAEINDEKVSRSMEIIISNVSPKTHFFSKIIASTGFVLFQSILTLLYGTIGLGIRSLLSSSITGDITGAFSTLTTTLSEAGIFDLLIQAAPLLIILFVVSFLGYALLAGILASMTTSLEDFQQLQTPLMIILMLGYYIGIMSSFFDGSIFIQILSYIPFMSTLIAPMLYIMEQTTIIDLIISNITLIITCLLLYKYGIKVYKVGILNYSSKDLWKKIFKSMKS